MRIVIDLQGAQSESRFRGIGRYSLSLAQAIARNAGEHEIWLALNARLPESIADIRAAFAGLIPDQRIRLFDVPTSRQSTPWVIQSAQVIRERFLDTLQPDVVLITSLFEGYLSPAVTSIGATPTRYKTAVVLYDLIPLLNQATYLPKPELQAYYAEKIEWLKKADALLAISDSSRQEAIEHLAITGEKIANISAAIGDQFAFQALEHEKRCAFLGRFGIEQHYILYAPGGFDPRKNFARLLQAYAALPEPLKDTHQLVIATRLHPPQRLELLNLTKQYGLRDTQLVLTDYVEDADLVTLYSHARLFVFPSLHEGFGLPVLEAMACGAPVIGSNCSSIPEVIGLAEALFDPRSVSDMALKIQAALENETFRVRLIDNALSQARTFSWDESGRKAIAALQTMSVPAQPAAPVSLEELYATLVSLGNETPDERQLHRTAHSIVYNFARQAGRQLLLDVSCIVHTDAKSGIQRVVRSLLMEFVTAPPTGMTVKPIYYHQGRLLYANRFMAALSGSAADTTVVDSSIDYWQDDIYLSLDLNMHLADALHPLLVRMQCMGVEINHIVYDLLLAQRPDWWPAPNPELFVNWLGKITELGSKLICISNAVAVELAQWIEAHPPARVDAGPKILSFHLGADIASSLPSSGLPESAAQVLHTMAARPSFLMVSTIEPRKGHAQTLDAFDRLWAQGVDINLVIVGKRGWLMDPFIARLEKHPQAGKTLFWLEGISDEYLQKVYLSAACLIAASEGEGFGLPLIEAAQQNLPMIIRDLAVFREVAGEHAFYFQGLSGEALADAITAWLMLFEQQRHPASSAMPWLTWEQSARQLKATLFE